jgi:hypothetical protein
MKRRFVIHPFLFAIYPILALYSHNIDQVFPWEIWRSLFSTLFLTVALFLLMGILIKDWERAGLLCSLFVGLFFSYGHVYSLMIEKRGAGFVLGRSDYLAAIWATVLIILSWLILRVLRKTAKITEYLNLISVFVLILPGYRVLEFNIQSISHRQAAPDALSPAWEPVEVVAPDVLPDIYYIIVDGYGRADVLDELYGYDNSEFIGLLERKGFCIAPQSHSNYAQTALSVASSLNYAYVHELTDLEHTTTTDRSPLANLVKDNRARSFLNNIGYQVVAIESGYSITEWDDADVYLASPAGFNSFETMLISSSAAVLILDRYIPYWYRDQILFSLDQLNNIVQLESPKFIFTHLTVPHPPFVFGPNGEPRPAKSFREGNYYDGTPKEYIEGYRGQITYLNKRLTETIATILASQGASPIIILQADHGPGAFLNWDSLEETCLRERMSVFYAIYLPGKGCELVYDSITPVNTFPLIFDAYFSTEIGFTSDKSFYSLWATPYELIDITDSIDTCNQPLAGE